MNNLINNKLDNLDNILVNNLYYYSCQITGNIILNFDNINTNLSNGYIIVNLNDILMRDALYNYLNYNDLSMIIQNIEKNINLINKINELNNLNYQVIYYLSIVNIIKYYIYKDIKLNILNKCQVIYNLLNNYIDKFNIMILFEYNKFNLRMNYFNVFIDNYIKNNIQYISLSYNNNKYLIGKFNHLDIKNIYKKINDNFLCCYRTKLKFISFDNLLNNLFKLNDNYNLSGYISPINKLSEDKKASLSSLNSILQKYSNNYLREIKILNDEYLNYYDLLNHNIDKYNDSIKEYITNILINHNKKGKILLGLNLHYIYDNIMLTNILDLLNELLINNIINSSKLNIHIINIDLLSIINDQLLSKDINTILNFISDNKLVILTGLKLNFKLFENIFKSCSDFNLDNIYFNFDINLRLRYSLSLYSYFDNILSLDKITDNILKNNDELYKNLISYHKLITNNNRNTNITNNKSNCCNCCNCQIRYNINKYDIKYIPYFHNIDQIQIIDLNTF